MTIQERRQIDRALHCPDDLVLKIHYTDREGNVTERIVSPIRMVNAKSMLALCLCRELPRRFDLDRCSNLELVNANTVLMPVPIRTVHAATA